MSRPRPFTDLHGFESAQTTGAHGHLRDGAAITESPRTASEPAGAPASVLAERATTVIGA